MTTIQKTADGYSVSDQKALSPDREVYCGPSAIGALHWALANAQRFDTFAIDEPIRRELCEALREMLCGAEADSEQPPTREAVVSYLKAQRDMQAERWSRFIELIERAEHSGD